MSFIPDKTAELQAAVQAGDPDRAAQVIVETVLESGQSIGDTLKDMTDAALRRHG